MSTFRHLNFHTYSQHAPGMICEAHIDSASDILKLLESRVVAASVTRASIPISAHPIAQKHHFAGCAVGIYNPTKEFYEDISHYITGDIYTPEQIVDAVNLAIDAACTAATPVIIAANRPKLSLDNTTSKFRLTIPAAFTSANWRFAGNEKFHTIWLCGFVTTTRNGVLGRTLSSTAPDQLQTFSTAQNIFMNEALVITTDAPIEGEINAGGSAGNNMRVLTDFSLAAISPAVNVEILPVNDRWVSLLKSGSITNINVKVFVRDKDGTLTPLRMPQHTHFSLKLCIRYNE